MDSFQTASELYMYIISVSLLLNEPYQTLVSLFYWGTITLHFLWRGMPDMPHSFGSEATDSFRGIWSSCK